MLISNFILPLAATIIIEAAIAYLLGWRGKHQLVLVAAVNAVTNPLINFIAIWIVYAGQQRYFYSLVLPMELLIIPAEWLMLGYAIPEKKRELLKLSALMNIFSFLFGLLIF